jgi:hypothetical protein
LHHNNFLPCDDFHNAHRRLLGRASESLRGTIGNATPASKPEYRRAARVIGVENVVAFGGTYRHALFRRQSTFLLCVTSPDCDAALAQGTVRLCYD